MTMELEITDKKTNPLLKRTEVQFIAKHENEGTPNRKLICSELADALNTKQENIIIDSISSSFGSHVSKGYAKAYSSLKNAQEVEREFQLKRNKVESKSKKKEEKEEKQPAAEEQKPSEESKGKEKEKEESQ
jgi:small subunit ribosomal protein S24e